MNGKVRKRPISSAKIKRDLHIEMKGHREAEKVPMTGSRPIFLRSFCIWTFFQSFLNLLFFAVHLNLALFCPPAHLESLDWRRKGGERVDGKPVLADTTTLHNPHNHMHNPHSTKKTTQPTLPQISYTSYTTHTTKLRNQEKPTQ